MSSTLSTQTRKIYDRELTRLESLHISLTGIKSIPAFFKKLMKTYKAHSIPYENFRLCLFAIRDHFNSIGKKLSKKMLEYLKKENIALLKTSYIGAGIEEAPVDTTSVTWNVIVQRTRPFVEDTENNVYDRLLVALYTFIPPRRSDYWSLVWGTPTDKTNTLSDEGVLNLTDYKTAKKYGEYRVDLESSGTFHGDPEAALFKSIIDLIPLEEKTGPVFKTRTGGSYTMVTFASKVRQLFTSVCHLTVSIMDLRRAFDQWMRARLSSPTLSMDLRGDLNKAIEMATAHSRAMSDYYADRVVTA